MAMTNEKLLQVIDALEGLIPTAEGLCDVDDYKHLRSMFPRLRAIVAEGRREKAMRWLGFIQDAYWLMGAAELEDLKKMNMAESVEYDAGRDAAPAMSALHAILAAGRSGQMVPDQRVLALFELAVAARPAALESERDRALVAAGCSYAGRADRDPQTVAEVIAAVDRTHPRPTEPAPSETVASIVRVRELREHADGRPQNENRSVYDVLHEQAGRIEREHGGKS